MSLRKMIAARGRARASAVTAWETLSLTQQSALLQLGHSGRHSPDRTLQILVRYGLATVRTGELQLHKYGYTRTGWGALVADVGRETIETIEWEAEHG